MDKNMDMPKKAVVEPPKPPVPPAKVEPQHEHPHEAAKPGGIQPKPKV